MRRSFLTGISFGLTTGVVTTLGLIVGLNASTNSPKIIIGGVITVAIADAFSDALGIHISEESETETTHRSVWESTIATFLAKFILTLTFIVPLLFLKLSSAIILDIVWGIFLLGIFSYYLAKKRNKDPYRTIIEHLSIALLVILATNLIGSYISTKF